ncbi:Amidase [Dactylella cylindrospora]|nr:Amidase [Dactylella cylindrospora]
MGGQTLNPYDLTRTPGGSSGGTAAALAANLAMVGCGGDTMNSIRSPASACNIVGFRPTFGRIARTGVVPVSWTQDAIGPMARTVADVQTLFRVMEGQDDGDSDSIGFSRAAPQLVRDEEHSHLQGLRIGVLKSYFNSRPEDTEEARQVQSLIDLALQKLVDKANVTTIPFEQSSWTIQNLHRDLDVQRFEFRQFLDHFFESNSGNLSNLGLRHPKDESVLNQILRKGEYDHVALPPETSMIHLATAHVDGEVSRAEHQRRLRGIATLKTELAAKFQELGVDVIVYPHQTQLPVKTGSSVQPNRNGLLASLTGHPSLCLPGVYLHEQIQPLNSNRNEDY